MLDEYAAKVAAMQGRSEELDLLRGETMRQTDTIAELEQRMQVMEVLSI